MQKKEKIPIKFSADKNKKNLISIIGTSCSDEANIEFLEKVLKVVYNHNASMEYYKMDNDLICIIRVLNSVNTEDTIKKIKTEINS